MSIDGNQVDFEVLLSKIRNAITLVHVENHKAIHLHGCLGALGQVFLRFDCHDLGLDQAAQHFEHIFD